MRHLSRCRLSFPPSHQQARLLVMHRRSTLSQLQHNNRFQVCRQNYYRPVFLNLLLFVVGLFVQTDPLDPPSVSSGPQVIPNFNDAWGAAIARARVLISGLSLEEKVR